MNISTTIRLRMSSHDAHYAGELVDGARMLALFGDVATELLIRLDGDEGLFRAYENVEFLAPVYAGDYVEAFGEIVHVGRSSRKMRFEARKIAGNIRKPGVPASAAEHYEPPIVVTRATGTCVVPVELQRPRLPGGPLALPGTEPLRQLVAGSSDLIVTAAIVGAEVTRAQTRWVPFTPEEIADEAARCREAGAAVIHLHVRTDDGAPTQSKDRFQATIEAIRRKSDVIVQVTTGGAVGMSIDERCQPLTLSPEMATLNCGTINFGDDVFVNTRREIRDIAARIREHRSVAECEVYEVGHLDEALALHQAEQPRGAAPRAVRARRARGARRARVDAALPRAASSRRAGRRALVGRRRGRSPPAPDDRARHADRRARARRPRGQRLPRQGRAGRRERAAGRARRGLRQEMGRKAGRSGHGPQHPRDRVNDKVNRPLFTERPEPHHPVLVVDVAVPVPVDHPFTFELPVALHTKVVPGMRVLVPFAGRRLLGVVLEVRAPRKETVRASCAR